MASSLAWTVGDAFGPWQAMATMARAEGAAVPLNDLSEAALVEACVAGRPGAFDLIVERHRRPIYQLCYRFVGNHEDASDLSQEVFLRAYRGLRSFRGQASIATWLYRISVNVCLNRVSVKTTLDRATASVDDQPLLDERSDSPPELLLREERAAQVRAAIAQLPNKQRATLILRTYHEMSHQEIADVLGSSVGAVKANFFHALGNLKKILGEI
ncbi:MAG TPA: RNA polymerase sigma factor [Vicinamibacterales bacterium]|nr:RNA polymerase sigma factor [Vicinamibacterales bacterium]